MTKEIDFILKVDKVASKTFSFTDDTGAIYDFTDSTVALKLYLGGSGVDPTSISGSIVVLTGKVTFSFTTTHTDNIGTYEYIIEETKADTSKVELVKGNIVIEEEVPFSTSVEAFLATELPATIQLQENYIQQRKLYWKLFLQSAAGIADSALYNDTSWSIQYRILISKLIAYDALELAGKGSYFQFMGGDYTNPSSAPGAQVKSITTGPSEVEFHDTLSSIEKIFTPGSYGKSAWDIFNINLCGLANQIGVKIPMCVGNDCIIVPSLSKNSNWERTTLSDLEEDSVVSIG